MLFLSLTVGLIGSVELFLQIQSQMELHLNNSTRYCILTNDINKMITLNIANRSTDRLAFLEDYQNQFNELMKTSIVTDRRINKQLAQIDIEQTDLEIFIDTPNLSPRRNTQDHDSI